MSSNAKSKIYNISFKIDKVSYRNTENYITLAKSKFEAFVLFIHYDEEHRDGNIFFDETNFDVKSILRKYYKTNELYINLVYAAVDDYKILNNWRYIEDNIKEEERLQYVNTILNLYSHNVKKELNLNKRSFMDEFRNFDEKFLNFVYKENLTTIKIEEVPHYYKLTFVAIKRILKTIKNTKYWYILRLF